MAAVEEAPQDFAASLEALAAEIADPVAGFFGPDSVTWKVNRETAIYLGGMRALLMQIAHPKVAQGVADFSNFRTDPLQRLRRTFDTVHAMVFGDRAEAVAAATRLHDVHQGVSGRLTDEVAGTDPDYRANDPELLLWVHATLVDSSLHSYATFLPPLSSAELDTFYAESKIFARLSGLDESQVPATLGEFRHYVDDMLAGPAITVTPTACEIAETLLKGPALLYLFRPSNYVLAAGMLPARLRDPFDLAWTLPVRAAYGIGTRVVSKVAPHLPGALRYVPSSRRAARRCADAGRPAA